MASKKAKKVKPTKIPKEPTVKYPQAKEEKSSNVSIDSFKNIALNRLKERAKKGV